MAEQDKVIAVFNAYDDIEVQRFSHALDYELALWDVEMFIREMYQHHLEEYDKNEMFIKIQEEIGRIREEHHLPQTI
jgi:hypothetical protein